MTQLKDKVALITGASRGIGKAIAFQLAEAGINVSLTGRSEETLTSVADEIKTKYNVKTYIHSGDLEDELIPAMIIKNTVFELGQLDILINNAGMALSKPIEETDIHEWQKLLSVNARAPFFLCKEAIQYLRKSNYGTIINISSVVGHKGYNDQAAYTASKHALTGFTKVLAKEVQKYNIHVHLISPGGVDTNMVEEMRPDLNASGLIKAENIANIVLFLLRNRGNATIDEIRIRRPNSTPWG
jgi:3-oxoacyl-[acyl-carrier protein] reductase